KAYGSIRGSSVLMHMPVAIVAPIYAGWVYDTTGSYLTAFTVFTVVLVVSLVVVSLASPPKPPAEITDIRKII
ncbi:hypothetical protein ACFLUU_06650, partial [Chloroflexota bacterium]